MLLEDLRQMIAKGREEMIAKAQKESEGGIEYRGKPTTEGELNSLARQLKRLEEEGGGEWAEGEKSLGQKPSDWIEDERGDLAKLIRD